MVHNLNVICSALHCLKWPQSRWAIGPLDQNHTFNHAVYV